MIPDFKTYIKESIWTDIQSRSAGKTIRKEDDINLLDETGLVNYMEKVYMSPNDDLHIIGDRLNFGTIMISLFEIDGKYYNIIYQKISTSNPEITFPVCPDSDIEDLLREHYTVIRPPRYQDKIDYIKPKDGSKVTNKFFLEIVDFILDAIKDDDDIIQIIFKKFCESIWTDIQSRSAGDTVRQEDHIDNMNDEQFYNYIIKHYTIRPSHIIYYKKLSEIFISICSKGDDVLLLLFNYDNNILFIKRRLKNVFPKLWGKLNDKYNLSEDEKDEDYIIIEPIDPKKGTTKTFVLEVLDFMIDNLDNGVNQLIFKNTNESIWTDIQSRSAGDTIRREDEFKDLYEFINKHYFVSFVGMDDIELKDNYIHIPIYKVVGLNSFSSVEIYRDKITFASIDPNRYKAQSLKKFVTHIKDDINQLFDKIKDTYSPEISTFDGLDHWMEFKIVPKNGKITKEFCAEVIDFVLNNTTDDNHKILKILEKK